MRLYISGPMSGIASYNFPAFFAAARSLKACGYDVINPAELHADEPEELPWCEYLRRDLIVLLGRADGVAVLPGYHQSEGAMCEATVATWIRLPVKQLDRWIEDAG